MADSGYIPRLHEENEVHICTNCGQTVRVTWAAVPIDALQCCGETMTLLGIKEASDELDLSDQEPPQGAQETIYLPGQRYTCEICGIEVTILRKAQPTQALDCCGEGMDLLG